MQIETITSLSAGASFFRGDLHIHSFGASHDVSDKGATPEAIIEVAVREKLRLISITDHNEISNILRAIEAGEKEGVVVIPGVELSTPEGHVLCYAPHADALERFYNRLSIADRRTRDCRCQTGTADCLNYLKENGGFALLAHVDLPGAFETNMPRMTPAKLDILCHPALLGIEVSRAECDVNYTDRDTNEERRSAAQLRIKRLGLGSQQFLARVLNSDAHTLAAVGRNAQNNHRITRYKMESPLFDGLRLALDAADTRVRLEDEIPNTVPIVEGVHFSGGFLDDQAIHFSPNLTCIIGGRGSGKSTVFESVRLLEQDYVVETGSVVDSDVWSDNISLAYRDETMESHALGRSKDGELENIDDPMSGSTSFPIESYRQGETNEISKRVQEDPLTLLTFLDRLVEIETAIAAEDELRTALIDMAPKVEKPWCRHRRITTPTRW